MEFTLSPAQIDLQDAVRRFCKRGDSSKPPQWTDAPLVADPSGSPRTQWETFGALGWLGVAFPEDAGGAGATAIEGAVILEEFGRSRLTTPYWSCALMAGHLIDQAAEAKRKKTLLASLIAGKTLFAVAHAETGSSDYEAPLGAVATRMPGGGFEISGQKSLVVGGPEADVFLVSARLDHTAGTSEGIFALSSSRPGLSRRDYRLLDGSSACDLHFSRVCVDEEALMGSPERTRPALAFATDQALAGLCAEAVGIADGVLWVTRDHLRLRRQYGAPLSSLQALQHRMADMFVEVELARSVTLQALQVVSQGDSSSRRKGVLAAHIQTSKSGMYVCKNGVQLHGAIGVTDEHPVAGYFRRMAVISRLFGGTERQLSRYRALT
jgi:alkylation response protein AidB-like acyl-CoA dehydrogenase